MGVNLFLAETLLTKSLNLKTCEGHEKSVPLQCKSETEIALQLANIIFQAR